MRRYFVATECIKRFEYPMRRNESNRRIVDNILERVVLPTKSFLRAKRIVEIKYFTDIE